MSALSRRTFLRGAGVALGLPLLDAMIPSAFRSSRDAYGAVTDGPPRRLLTVMTNMGIMPNLFFPKTDARNDLSSPYLDRLRDFHDRLTVFTGVSHPDVDGGHHSDIAFLTAAPHPGRSGFRSTISLDQFIAERIGHLTRFPSLSLLVGKEGKRSLSWTRGGVMIPSEKSPSAVFRQLFVRGNPSEVDIQLRRLQEGRSILDVVNGRAKQLERRVGANDRRKLDQYFTSVRELEARMHRAEEWEKTPKPKVDVPVPNDINDPADLMGKSRLMYGMAKLALETDSTRTVSIFVEQDHNPTVKLPGVSQGHHSLTHHGNRPENVGQLRQIEEAQFDVLGELLSDLQETSEQGTSLLDRTAVLYGTNLGNANSHSNVNMPVVLAGGGFRHGQQLVFDRKRNEPLPNLFVSLLQRLGLEEDRFASSTGTMRFLEMI